MSTIYLIRHGQAGTRDAYDLLSDIGHMQARLLGDHLASREVPFAAVYSGGMRRQQETAAEVRDAYRRAGAGFPEIVTDTAWNEFDLSGVYDGIAPQLAADDAAFRQEYEEMQAAIHASGGAPDAPVHRRWTACDIAVVRAWVAGRYSYDGESWEAFLQRVGGRVDKFPGAERDANIAVFTSATPTAIWAAMALEIRDVRVLQLAGVLYNTAYSVLRYRAGEIRLFSFNNVPHLVDKTMFTFR